MRSEGPKRRVLLPFAAQVRPLKCQNLITGWQLKKNTLYKALESAASACHDIPPAEEPTQGDSRELRQEGINCSGRQFFFVYCSFESSSKMVKQIV